MAQDPATVYSIGTVCAALLAMLGLVLREVLARNKETTEYVRAATEVLVELRDQVADAKATAERCLEETREMRGELARRPCALVQHPGLLEAVRSTPAPATH
jgi:hypothetical protein